MRLQDNLVLQMNNILAKYYKYTFDYIADKSYLSNKMKLSSIEKTVIKEIYEGNFFDFDVSVINTDCQTNDNKTAYIVLGAIGSGKSTIAKLLYCENFFANNLEFLCEDLIKSTYFDDIFPLKKAYCCAKIYLKYKLYHLLQSCQDFVYELVPSNQKKLEVLKLIKNSGYKLISIYLCTDNEQLNQERIKKRMLLGADYVPSEKVSSRYEIVQNFFDEIISISDVAYIVDSLDNSFKLKGYSDDKHIVRLII